jgi:hypothetical protein
VSSSKKVSLIQRLQRELPRGKPFGSRELAAIGVYPELAYRYVKSGWIERLAHGLFRFASDELDRDKCLAFLGQRISQLHVGGKTALAWQGFRHNLPRQEKLHLWGPRNSQLPEWFTQRFPARYTVKVLFDASLMSDFGLQPLPENPQGVGVAVPERALLEMLSDVGVHQEVDEARQIMESVRSLRPDTLQPLLHACTQVKAFRLCLTWATELQLPWAEAARKAASDRAGKSRWVTRLKNGHTLILKP